MNYNRRLRITSETKKGLHVLLFETLVLINGLRNFIIICDTLDPTK